MTTRETLLQKATELFASEGYNGVSVRKLARAAGITEGSIYNHFASKNEILEEILDEHARQLESQMPISQALIDSYGKEDWQPAWARRIKFMEQQYPEDLNMDILKLLSSEQYKNPKAGKIIQTYYIEKPVEITYRLFKHLEDKGEVLPGTPMELARIYQYPLFSLTQEFAIAASQGEDTQPVLDKMKSHVTFFWCKIMKRNFDF